jgi:hypothetical protein
VALSGDTVVVGAHHDDHGGGPYAGAAYVFVRNGTSWSEQAKLIASDTASFDRFGFSMAFSDDTVVVGAYNDEHAGGLGAGSAYVFVRNGTSWSEQAKLIASDARTYDQFGNSVALSGDTAVVGASFSDNLALFDNAGSAYVFVRNGTSWSEQAELIASDALPDVYFGNSVALSGDTAVVGAAQDSSGGVLSGSAYVFVRSGSTWSEQTKLRGSDTTFYDFFGSSVTLSGNTAVVAATGNDHAGDMDAGAAYVFLGSGANWSELAKLTASDAAAGNGFGKSVRLSGDTVVMGSSDVTETGSAFVFQLPQQAPLALCMDVTVFAGSDCTADASIDAGSFDPDGDPITLSQEPPGPYGLGDTLVTLTVTDEQGASGSCMATVTVADTTAPQLSVVLTPDTLWPPNHHMVDVQATVIASDNCGTPTIALASLTSNEADDALGRGDGKTTGDIQPGTDDFHFSLRAERAGAGSGRIYTVVYTATDGAGNAASEAGLVVVPHDLGGVIDPVTIALEQSASGTVVSWAVVSGAESYDVIRGELNNVVEIGMAIKLGTVVCIEANSTDESTSGWEDGELPEPGQAFFYLVEYYDGISSTYGTESADKPRAPGPGDCQ